MKMEGNLTKGPILKTLTKLAVPIMASSFLGTLYNITDMAWIGLLGSKAVAGVGVGGMFTWLSQGLAARIFSACRCTGSCGGNVIYEDCLWADCIFFYDADTDWTLYGTGRFKDTFYSESCRPGHKYGSGSCVDSWSGDVSEAWCCRGCNCDSDSTGDRYEYHDSRNCHTKERKCTKRN